jgi:hypothetical protein
VTVQKEVGTAQTRIHGHSTGPQGALVNASLVETSEPVVAVDRTASRLADGTTQQARRSRER